MTDPPIGRLDVPLPGAEPDRVEVGRDDGGAKTSELRHELHEVNRSPPILKHVCLRMVKG